MCRLTNLAVALYLTTLVSNQLNARQVEKNSCGETSDTTGRPHCLESGLAITDATAASLAIFRRNPPRLCNF
jgi:hypothetical protein